MAVHRNQKAHTRLNDWSFWLSQFQDSSALGAKIVNYDSSRSGVPPSSIVPNVFRDPLLVETEAAIEDQTPKVRRSIFAYYVYSHEDPRFFKLTRRQLAYMLDRVARSLGY